MSFEGIKDKIVYKLINYNANRKLLSLVPHKKILDLAMVYYCILGEIEDGNATALIYNSNIKNWHIKEDELYRTAVSNTPKLLPVKIYEMSELIQQREDIHWMILGAVIFMYLLIKAELMVRRALCMREY